MKMPSRPRVVLLLIAPGERAHTNDRQVYHLLLDVSQRCRHHKDNNSDTAPWSRLW